MRSHGEAFWEWLCRSCFGLAVRRLHFESPTRAATCRAPTPSHLGCKNVQDACSAQAGLSAAWKAALSGKIMWGYQLSNPKLLSDLVWRIIMFKLIGLSFHGHWTSEVVPVALWLSGFAVLNHLTFQQYSLGESFTQIPMMVRCSSWIFVWSPEIQILI